MVITNKKIYTSRKKKVKPLIQIADVTAFTFSKDIKNKHFIIHIKNSMDELFYGEYIMHILDAIKHVYYLENKKNLPVYEISENTKIEKYAKTFD